MWRSLLLDTTEKMTQLRILFVENVSSAFSRQCLAVLVSIQMDIQSVHKYQNLHLFYSSRGTGVWGLCTSMTLIKLLNIRCLHYALNSWKDQQNDNNWTACRSCQDSGGVNTVGTCGVEGFRDVCWMGVGKLIHIHRRQDCLLNPLKAWSGWETLMLPHITPYIYFCCWSVHGWHDHHQFFHQWDGLPIWMRNLRNGWWINADALDPVRRNAGTFKSTHWPQVLVPQWSGIHHKE